MQEKKALAREVSKRYQNAGKKEKAGMLDELVKTTGYNRKYVLHVLANWGKTVTVSLGGEAVRLEASPRKWRQEAEIPRRFCHRLAQGLGVFLVPVREDTGHLRPGADGVLGRAVSHNGKRQGTAPFRQPATIDRLLKPDKKKPALKGKSGTKP